MHLQRHTLWRLALLTLLSVCLFRKGHNGGVEAQRVQRRNGTNFRIVGGFSVTVQQAPFLVQVRVDLKFVCGGTLVRENYCVTAAHCVVGVKARQLRIVGGATTLTQNGWQANVLKYFLMRGWGLASVNNDVCVMKLDRMLRGPNIRPIPLASIPCKAGTIVRVFGWGILSERGTRLAETIRAVDVPIINRYKCALQYRGYANLTKSMMCAGVPGLKDSCTADSGGPLICGNSLYGVVSFGNGCAEIGYPGVYTKILAVKRFILRCIRKG